MAAFQQQPPTRIKLRRDAIIHAIAYAPKPHDLYAVGDDEALTVFDAKTDHATARYEDVGTVLSVCFLGDGAVAAGTLRGLVAIRPRPCCCAEDLALAPASVERAGVRAIAASAARLAAGDADGRIRIWLIGAAGAAPLFSLRAARDRTCAVEALALGDDHRLFVARSALSSATAPLLSVWALHADDPPEVSWSSDDDTDDGDVSDGDEYNPWHPTLERRLIVNPTDETVDVHAIVYDGDRLVAGAADGSVAAWNVVGNDAWRCIVGKGIQEIAMNGGGIVVVPLGVGAAAAPLYFCGSAFRVKQNVSAGDGFPDDGFADGVTLAPPARKPVGPLGANCGGCGTPALVWDGSVQSGCPVCTAGTLVNAYALAPDGTRLLAGGYDRSLHAWDLSAVSVL